MAGKLDVKGLIVDARKMGMSDQQIYSELQKTPQFSSITKSAKNELKMNDNQIASQFGLVINVKMPSIRLTAEGKAKVGMQPIKTTAKAPSKTESFIIGAVNDIGGGINQGVSQLKDMASSGLNSVFGTNLDTARYDRVTRETKAVNDQHEKRRADAGKTGLDGWRLAGNVAASIPFAPATSGSLPVVVGKSALTGAGLGGASFAKDSNERLSNVVSGALGGAIGAGVGQKVGEGVVKVVNKIPTRATTQKISATIDDQIEIALKQSNVKISDLSDNVVAGLRKEVGAALKSGKAVNKEAVARKVVLDRVGIKNPTRAQLTGNPILWQKQAELAKIQGAGDPLRQTLINNENQVIGALDDVITKTGGKATDQYGAIKGAADSLLDQNAQNKAFVGAAYDNAVNAPGNDVLINGAGLANDVFTKLDDAALASFLPPDISKKIVQISENPQLFTLKKGEELIKILNTHYKSSLQNGQPTATTHALGIVRQSLQGRQDEALQGLLVNGGNDAAQAYQFARQAHKANAELTQRMPLLQDALKGVEPDKLFQKHILGGNAAQLGETIEVLKNTNPQAVADIKQQTLLWISNKSVNQNGGFSPAGMKKALDSLGDRRLLTMFDANELSHIKDIAKAGDYLVTQPNHAYVNNSNTSAALMNFFGGLINKPGVRVLLSPLKDVADSVKVSRSLKGSVAGEAVPAATNPLISNTQLEIINKLSKAGLVGGANLQD